MDTLAIGRRIAQRRKELTLTLEDIANRVELTKSTIQRYEAAKIKTPKIAVLRSISDALDVPYEWLIGDIDELPSHTLGNILENAKSGIPVPIYSSISVEMNAENKNSDAIDGYIFEETSFLNRRDKYVYLRITDNTMFPEFKIDDFVLIKLGADVDNHSYAVVNIDGADGIIKSISMSPEKIVLNSINPMYAPLKFEGEDVSRLRIFGSVVSLKRIY